ncbi:uncharacterized protein BXZ73DRAFT_107485 [Epithele typhae]|uniref:uncharacterized protein n=1 Tax=Epithele typhae TaxID=378194 RepID=UPI002007948E|nr:uncharacterized protein BXZ73DRAFT_107485 [Epithele typhae]KAH9912353.1 hypothetical protein BXZ73DRAFT_107485 [Epithele typhae]
MKVLVGTVLASETLNSVDIISLYQPLVLQFGDYVLVTHWCASNFSPSIWTSREPSPTEFHIDPAMLSFVAFVWIVGFTYIYAFISFLGDVGMSIAVTKSRPSPTPKFKAITHRKTGMDFTDTLINKITRVTIETGLLTSMWPSMDLIVYLVVPTSLHLLFTAVGDTESGTGDESNSRSDRRGMHQPRRVNMPRCPHDLHAPGAFTQHAPDQGRHTACRAQRYKGAMKISPRNV